MVAPLTWKELYRAAITEPDPEKLSTSIEQARAAIMARIEELLDDVERRPEHDDILRALNHLEHLDLVRQPRPETSGK